MSANPVFQNIGSHYADFFSLLVHDEGCRASAYDDISGENLKPGTRMEGEPTIGIGENIGVNSPLENDLIEFIALYRIHQYATELQKLPFWSRLDTARKAVLIGMMFNLGIRGFYEFQRMLTAIHEGDFVEAANEIEKSLAYKQDKRRYSRYKTIMLSGEFTSNVLDQPPTISNDFLNFLENFKTYL